MCESPIFTCDGLSFGPRHLLAAGAVWGVLDTARARVSQGLAALEWAYATECTVDDDVLQSASEDFRRAQGLRSAQATADWLRMRSVSLDDFGDYLEREAVISLYGKQVPSSAHASLENPETDTVWAQLVFSGDMGTLARKLARYVAVAGEDDAHPPSSLDEAAMVRAYDGYFKDFAQQALNAERLENALANRWGDLFRIRYALGYFDHADAAHEARLCVVQDGATLSEIASSASAEYREGDALLLELPEALRAGVQAAGEGAVMPVTACDGHYVVCMVREKRAPSLEDAATYARVQEGVLEDITAPLVSRRITWVCEGL